MPQLKRPKIVHLVVAGQIGGAEHFLVNFASNPEWSGADHCIALMTPNDSLRRFFLNSGLSIRDRGPVRENVAAYLWRSFGPYDLAWLEELLVRESATLIHAHTFGSQVLAVRASRRLRIPVIRTEHGVGIYRDPTAAFLSRWALKHTDLTVAVSDFVARTIIEVLPDARSRIRVIPNGIDVDRFSPVPLPSGGPFTLSIVSRVEHVKRIDIALRALALVPEIELEIAGDGSERAKLEALARKLGISGRVRFMGYRDDPRLTIGRSHASVNCTHEEGLSLSAIEAAAMGRPTIAFANGGIEEIVRDGCTGWSVREHNPVSFAAAFASASSDRALVAEYGRNARAMAEAKFTIERMCKDYRVAYEALSIAPGGITGANPGIEIDPIGHAAI